MHLLSSGGRVSPFETLSISDYSIPDHVFKPHIRRRLEGFPFSFGDCLPSPGQRGYFAFEFHSHARGHPGRERQHLGMIDTEFRGNKVDPKKRGSSIR